MLPRTCWLSSRHWVSIPLAAISDRNVVRRISNLLSFDIFHEEVSRLFCGGSPFLWFLTRIWQTAAYVEVTHSHCYEQVIKPICVSHDPYPLWYICKRILYIWSQFLPAFLHKKRPWKHVKRAKELQFMCEHHSFKISLSPCFHGRGRGVHVYIYFSYCGRDGVPEHRSTIIYCYCPFPGLISTLHTAPACCILSATPHFIKILCFHYFNMYVKATYRFRFFKKSSNNADLQFAKKSSWVLRCIPQNSVGIRLKAVKHTTSPCLG